MSDSPSFHDQAAYLERLIGRCIMRDKSIATITQVTLTSGDVLALQGISRRLGIMAAHEKQIRDLVRKRS